MNQREYRHRAGRGLADAAGRGAEHERAGHARDDERPVGRKPSLRSQDVARQVAELNVSAEQSLARLDAVLADAARAAQGEADYLARVEAALAEEPEAGMTLLGRTVSWTETNDEGRTLTCAVELQERGAFPRYVRTVYRLATDEGEPDGEERLFDARGSCDHGTDENPAKSAGNRRIGSVFDSRVARDGQGQGAFGAADRKQASARGHGRHD